MRSDERIRMAATEKMDSRVLSLASRDLVAAEAHYHKSCYRDYTRILDKPNDVGIVDETATDPEMIKYQAAVSKSYEELFYYIRNDVFLSPRIVAMTELTEKLSDLIHSKGIESIKPHTKKHIRRQIENEFPSSVHFLNIGGRLLLWPDSLKIYDLVKENFRLSQEVRSYSTSKQDPNHLIKQAASYLRSQIKTSCTSQEWPVDPSSINDEYTKVPTPLQDFFEMLLSGDTNCKDLSGRVKRLANSYACDCIYGVSVGKHKTAKHILLPWAVKSLTGNVELIKILNRFGHGISYSQMEELDTELCLKKLDEEEEKGVALPTNIVPGMPTVLAYDNIDRNEETLTGQGTSHRINGIAIQEKVINVIIIITTTMYNNNDNNK